MLRSSDGEIYNKTLLLKDNFSRVWNTPFICQWSIKCEGEKHQFLILFYLNFFPFSGFVRSPCGVCPVIQDCGESGLINPSSCQYFKDWLDFWSSRINPYSCQYFKDWWDFWSSKINPSRCQYFKDCMVRFLII